MKINFINPFGTPIYDDLIRETLVPFARADSVIVITHTKNCPDNIDYYYSKHLVETVVYEEIIQSERDGFDAVIVGCCYDPGVRVARELVDIPVIGPLEASIKLAPYYGYDFVVVTDHHKAVPELRDLVMLYSGTYCRDVSCINWFVTDMIKNTPAVARDAQAKVAKVLETTRAEVAILGCTIISACVERELLRGTIGRDHTILNPNTMALKMAELLGDLRKQGAYNISRQGFYQKHQQHNAPEYESVRARFGRAKKG